MSTLSSNEEVLMSKLQNTFKRWSRRLKYLGKFYLVCAWSGQPCSERMWDVLKPAWLCDNAPRVRYLRILGGHTTGKMFALLIWNWYAFLTSHSIVSHSRNTWINSSTIFLRFSLPPDFSSTWVPAPELENESFSSKPAAGLIHCGDCAAPSGNF